VEVVPYPPATPEIWEEVVEAVDAEDNEERVAEEVEGRLLLRAGIAVLFLRDFSFISNSIRRRLSSSRDEIRASNFSPFTSGTGSAEEGCTFDVTLRGTEVVVVVEDVE